MKESKGIFAAVRERDLSSLRQHLDSKVGIESRNKHECTPLLQASLLGYAEVVSEILKYRPKLDVTDEDGNTALILAARFDRIDVIKLLLDAGDDINARNKLTQDTALMNASGYASAECARLFLRGGVDINAKNSLEVTALMRAADNDNVDCAALLVSEGALVDLFDTKGRTALFRALIAGSYRICKILIEAGADADLPDKEGTTSRTLGRNSKDAAIRQLITGPRKHD